VCSSDSVAVRVVHAAHQLITRHAPGRTKLSSIHMRALAAAVCVRWTGALLCLGGTRCYRTCSRASSAASCSDLSAGDSGGGGGGASAVTAAPPAAPSTPRSSRDVVVALPSSRTTCTHVCVCAGTWCLVVDFGRSRHWLCCIGGAWTIQETDANSLQHPVRVALLRACGNSLEAQFISRSTAKAHRLLGEAEDLIEALKGSPHEGAFQLHLVCVCVCVCGAFGEQRFDKCSVCANARSTVDARTGESACTPRRCIILAAAPIVFAERTHTHELRLCMCRDNSTAPRLCN
jgi:hypothetical protein